MSLSVKYLLMMEKKGAMEEYMNKGLKPKNNSSSISNGIHLKWNSSEPLSADSLIQLLTTLNPPVEVKFVEIIDKEANQEVVTFSNQSMCDACVKTLAGVEHVNITRLDAKENGHLDICNDHVYVDSSDDDISVHVNLVNQRKRKEKENQRMRKL